MITFDHKDQRFRMLKYGPEEDKLMAVSEWTLPDGKQSDGNWKCAVLNDSGSVFAIGFGRVIIVFYQHSAHGNVAEKHHVILSDHTEDVTSLSMAKDGSLIVSGSNDGNVISWKRKDDTWSPTVMERYRDSIHHVAVKPDGQVIAGASDDETGHVHAWEFVYDSWNYTLLKGHTDKVVCIAINNKGLAL